MRDPWLLLTAAPAALAGAAVLDGRVVEGTRWGLRDGFDADGSTGAVPLAAGCEDDGATCGTRPLDVDD